MKLEHHRQFGAKLQQVMCDVRELQDAIDDTGDRHIDAKQAKKELHRAWIMLEVARSSLRRLQ